MNERVDAREQARIFRTVAREGDAMKAGEHSSSRLQSRSLRAFAEQHEADRSTAGDDLEGLDQAKLALVECEPPRDEHEPGVGVVGQAAEDLPA